MLKLTARFSKSCTFIIQPVVSISTGNNPNKVKYKRRLKRLLRDTVTNQLLEKGLIDNIKFHIAYRNSVPILFDVMKEDYDKI